MNSVRNNITEDKHVYLKWCQGYHSDWKTWNNGKAIFQLGKSRGILNRLEKLGDNHKNTGNLIEF